MARLLPSPPPARIGVAVSGGGDSAALMHLASAWATRAGVALEVATIDHGLRAEAAAEAALVASGAETLGLPHETLHWRGWDGRGNLQDQARRARYGLLTAWAQRRGLRAVLLGHTRNDNAECVLLGLSRGAGLDGLSGMRPAFRRSGVLLVRPLLSVPREALRDWLLARHLHWIDDPSNEDNRFARVRAREALDRLSALGITAEALARSAENLRRTREGLQEILRAEARAHCSTEAGDVIVAPGALEAMPEEIARRLLNAALRWVACADYPPRAQNVALLMGDGEARHAGMTLHGCLVRETPDGLRISREPEAARRAPTAGPEDLWDGRWQVAGPFQPDMVVRDLGEAGLSQAADWRASGLPRATCLASPAVWQGETLRAAPLLEPNGDFVARVVPDFFEGL
ncbi:tRNA(Ile)-lysidine synthase [Tropicimonas isoalkanivorans]|uniref:tRNA(Ile)-lysidine synthase n=1 Tax=Tropicimonas isoalkanivorans TaxID=441112 RepID=A0A1I1NFV1_9RHOB|nr:tRNA(Ile)-lysidine synthase [Tropicimonas isoalkanivorans]